MNFTELSAQVQDELGQNGDTDLITTARCGQWVNAAYQWLARNWPYLEDLRVTDKTTWYPVTNKYIYALSDFSTYSVNQIIRLRCVHYGNGDPWVIKPFPGGNEAFDGYYPCPPLRGTGQPLYYIRRGGSIELDMPFDSSYAAETDSGATGTDATASVITASAGTPFSADLDGDYVYLEGTNCTSGWYEIDSSTTSTITLTSNASSGGAMSALYVRVHTHIITEYAQQPATLTGTDDPVLNGFDECIVAKAMAYGYNAMGTKFKTLAASQHMLAEMMAQDIAGGEAPLDTYMGMADDGP